MIIPITIKLLIDHVVVGKNEIVIKHIVPANDDCRLKPQRLSGKAQFVAGGNLYRQKHRKKGRMISANDAWWRLWKNNKIAHSDAYLIIAKLLHGI
jgi:hypothetical protein